VITIRADLKVLVAAQPVDFRKGMDALAGLVAERLSEDPYAGTNGELRRRQSNDPALDRWPGETPLFEPLGREDQTGAVKGQEPPCRDGPSIQSGPASQTCNRSKYSYNVHGLFLSMGRPA